MYIIYLLDTVYKAILVFTLKLMQHCDYISCCKDRELCAIKGQNSAVLNSNSRFHQIVLFQEEELISNITCWGNWLKESLQTVGPLRFKHVLDKEILSNTIVQYYNTHKNNYNTMPEIEINLEKPQLSHGALYLASSSPVTTLQLCVEAWQSRTSCGTFGQSRWVNPLPCILLSTLGKSFNILPASKTWAVEALWNAMLEGNCTALCPLTAEWTIVSSVCVSKPCCFASQKK